MDMCWNPLRTFVVSATFILLFGFASPALASYDSGPGYGVSHSSYPAAPVAVGGHGGQGWGSGHSAGSYYHYHVPLVGQQSHYPPPAPPQQSSDHSLYYLLPLLLLAALPLLFLPLLPLLLLPLGISLLGLLLPLLLMGGMMMMMMMDGGMMMMMRNRGTPHRNSYNNGDSRSFSMGDLLLEDLNSLMSKYARSLDLDHCPERIACEAGNFMFPDNATEGVTARTIMDFVVEQATPKGKTRRLLRSYKQAFWSGSKNGNCTLFKCQPVFRIFPDADTPVSATPETGTRGGAGFESRANNGTGTGYTYSDYYNLYGQPNISTSYYGPGLGLGLGLGSDPALQYYSPLNNVTSASASASASASDSTSTLTSYQVTHHPSAFTSYYGGSPALNFNQNHNQRKFKSRSKPKTQTHLTSSQNQSNGNSPFLSYGSSPSDKLTNDITHNIA